GDTSDDEVATDGEEDHPDAVVYRMTAWMPEQIAVMKLRGCLPDIGGEVVASAPGALRIRLARRVRPEAPAPRPGLWARIGLGQKPAAGPATEWVDMELRMKSTDPARPNQLAITAVLRPAARVSEGDADDWQTFCAQVSVNLSAYLMARR